MLLFLLFFFAFIVLLVISTQSNGFHYGIVYILLYCSSIFFFWSSIILFCCIVIFSLSAFLSYVCSYSLSWDFCCWDETPWSKTLGKKMFILLTYLRHSLLSESNARTQIGQKSRGKSWFRDCEKVMFSYTTQDHIPDVPTTDWNPPYNH